MQNELPPPPEPATQHPPAATRWFYKQGTEKVGPLDGDALRRLLVDGSLPPETLVWREGLSGWGPAADLQELAQAVNDGRVKATTLGRLRRKRAVLATIPAAVILAWYMLPWLFAGLAGASVTGAVTSSSQPVRGGTLILAPVVESKSMLPGTSGVASVGEDGRFTVRLAPGREGLAKRFRVRFSPPVLPVMDEAEAMKAVPPYAGLVPKDSEVTIVRGDNRLDVELVPARVQDR